MQRALLIVVLFFAALAPAADAQSTPLKGAVNAQVAAAKRIAPETGVVIVELASGEAVYSYNPDTARIPASNTKLFTTAAALDLLGPGAFFETEVLARGAVAADGTLEGDLAVVGGGDPNISGRPYYGDSYAVFREWAAALRARGVARIGGDLLLVDGYFDREHVHPDWPADQLDHWYEAPVGALSFNDNCVLVKVSPGDADGDPARVETVPPLGIFSVASTALTISSGRGSSSGTWTRIGRRFGDQANVLTVDGRLRRHTESVDKWVTVDDPASYFGAALVDALAEEGIPVAGRVRIEPSIHLFRQGGAPPWEHVAVHRSDLLSTLEVVNKRSQNFYAESVLKWLGARLCGEGSWAAGLRVVDDFLRRLGLEGYTMADGSGMSRGNRFSPRQVTHLLERMFHHRYGVEFLATLPVSGEFDLRWERRLARPPYLGNVMAKTGTLAGVSALSGYAKGRSGKLYVFSILMNGARTTWQAQDAQDKIVMALIDAG